MKALRDPNLNFSSAGQIMKDIKASFHSIVEAIVTYTRCNANSLSQSCEWTVSPQNAIIDLLVEECVRH